jgi:hypothetical protein
MVQAYHAPGTEMCSQAVNELPEIGFFPLLEKEGWPKAGVVIYSRFAELTTRLRLRRSHPSFSRRGNLLQPE